MTIDTLPPIGEVLVQDGVCSICGETGLDGSHHCAMVDGVVWQLAELLGCFELLDREQRADMQAECARIVGYDRARARVFADVDGASPDAKRLTAHGDCWEAIRKLLEAMDHARPSNT